MKDNFGKNLFHEWKMAISRIDFGFMCLEVKVLHFLHVILAVIDI